MAESDFDSVQQKVLQRAKEIQRLKTGKACETVSRADTDVQARNSPICSDGNSNDWGNPVTSQRLAETGEAHELASERGQLAVGGSDALWERISKMEETMRKTNQQQVDILSNVVINMAKMQKKLDKSSQSTSEHQTDDESEDDTTEGSDGHDRNGDGNGDGLDQLLAAQQGNDSAHLLDDLEECYKDDVVLGPDIHAKLADLVNNAIEKKLGDDAIKGLENKYLIPKNCPKMMVPKVNRELWQAFKPNRPADLAMQGCQKYMQMAMVPVIKSLETIMTGGNVSQIQDMLKDTFRILAHGMNDNTRKRRALIRPMLPAKYRKVCSTDTPTTEFLFGEGLDQRVEDIEKEERRAQKLSGRPSMRPTGHFLGQRFPQGNKMTNTPQGTRLHNVKPYQRQPRYHQSQGKPQSQKRPVRRQ